MSSDLKSKIVEIMDKHQVGTLATIRNSRPYSRFMLFFHEDTTLYTCTNKETHKVDDVANNPYVHVLLGYEGKGWEDSYVEIEAKASVEESSELKQKFWTDKLSEWLSGPDDPNFVLLKLEPEKIRYIEKAGSEPQVLK
ncbi:pyridoxamine 5'-phosphate oxidase family protein [Bacillus timonensis]|nr:pyridoxamine 5'-phosphate oxidase family protein [Bacillus timonensis]